MNTIEQIKMKAKELIKRQEEALENNTDTIEEEAMDFIRQLAL